MNEAGMFGIEQLTDDPRMMQAILSQLQPGQIPPEVMQMIAPMLQGGGGSGGTLPTDMDVLMQQFDPSLYADTAPAPAPASKGDRGPLAGAGVPISSEDAAKLVTDTPQQDPQIPLPAAPAATAPVPSPRPDMMQDGDIPLPPGIMDGIAALFPEPAAGVAPVGPSFSAPNTSVAPNVAPPDAGPVVDGTAPPGMPPVDVPGKAEMSKRVLDNGNNSLGPDGQPSDQMSPGFVDILKMLTEFGGETAPVPAQQAPLAQGQGSPLDAFASPMGQQPQAAPTGMTTGTPAMEEIIQMIMQGAQNIPSVQGFSMDQFVNGR